MTRQLLTRIRLTLVPILVGALIVALLGLGAITYVQQRQLADFQKRIATQGQEIRALQARPSIAPEVVSSFGLVAAAYDRLNTQEGKTEATLNSLARHVDSACSTIADIGAYLRVLYRNDGLGEPSSLTFLGCR
jgi:hypothetical protein